VYSRLVSGCPYCANKKLLKGYNDLQTKNSELCKEWNDNRNPEDFMEFSNEKVSWKCLHCGHEWSATIAHRSNGEGCPRCKRHHQKSVNEVAIAYYLDGLVEYEHGYRPDFLSGGELDIYIDSIRLGIEYDGRYFHEGRFEKDLMKDSVCKECGIEVIHIREKGLPQLKDSQTIQVDGEDYSSVDAAITQVLSIVFSKVGINPVIKVDVKRDGQAIRAKRFNDEVEGSFASKHPELLDEWAPSNKLKPQAVPEFANYNVDWICSKCNNTWSASPATRSKNSGCPFCSGRKVIPGVTDLATVKKDLAKEWHPTKNIITPKQVSVGSHEKVWWLGSCNHEWRAEIKSRALGGNKCPFCAGKEVLVGFNDLKSQKLELAKEWHPT
jgi:DNA-directed RNA polymerase subunit RPC12/RpoP